MKLHSKNERKKERKKRLLICRLSSALSAAGETAQYLVLGFWLENGASALVCGRGVVTEDRR